MIKRDIYGYICQHNPSDEGYLDGGDSSRATAMVAMSGSARDQFLLPQFEYLQTGLLRRHPMQPIFSDTNNFTRDQLVQFMGGLNATIKSSKGDNKTYYINMAKRIFWSHAKRGFFCQNTHDIHGNKKPWYKSRDPLPLSNIGQMIIAAKLYLLYPLLPICFLWLLLDIFWSSNIKPLDENNQIIALCDVYGKWALKLYCWMNPLWKYALHVYWGENQLNFRYQPEIADKIISYVESRIH